jgi:nitroimidazol reductase NimA-like FMN-containing flavoprotein (pyridoxamine 5'-phosphate oxidase superfamily)
MKIVQLDAVARDAFLAGRRLGILALLDDGGAPIALPLWYRWDGREIEMVSERKVPKIRRLQKEPRASVLVTNIPPEPGSWVSLEGRIAITEGGQATGERLIARYVDDVRIAAATRKAFRAADLVRLSFVPDRIRTYAEIY